MSRESTDSLKMRLLRDPEVQMMIRMRAFEIYQIRGNHPGSQAEDWFQAEMEVLSFLIEEENRLAAESAPRRARKTVAGVELAMSPGDATDPESLGGWPAEAPPPPKPKTRKTGTGAGAKSPSARAKTASAPGTAKKTTARSAKKAAPATAGKTASGAKKSAGRKGQSKKEDESQ